MTIIASEDGVQPPGDPATGVSVETGEEPPADARRNQRRRRLRPRAPAGARGGLAFEASAEWARSGSSTSRSRAGRGLTSCANCCGGQARPHRVSCHTQCAAARLPRLLHRAPHSPFSCEEKVKKAKGRRSIRPSRATCWSATASRTGARSRHGDGGQIVDKSVVVTFDIGDDHTYMEDRSGSSSVVDKDESPPVTKRRQSRRGGARAIEGRGRRLGGAAGVPTGADEPRASHDESRGAHIHTTAHRPERRELTDRRLVGDSHAVTLLAAPRHLVHRLPQLARLRRHPIVRRRLERELHADDGGVGHAARSPPPPEVARDHVAEEAALDEAGDGAPCASRYGLAVSARGAAGARATA